MRRGTDGIKADVCEKHNARGAEYPENSSIRVGDALRCDVRGRRWNERSVVRRIYKVPPDSDHEQHDTHLQDDDKAVDECRFFRAANQE